MAWCHGVKTPKEYNLLVQGIVTGRKSMAQSYRWCREREVASDLLKTFFRSRYSEGTEDRSGNTSDSLSSTSEGAAACKQEMRQVVHQSRIWPDCQLLWGHVYRARYYPIGVGGEGNRLHERRSSLGGYQYSWRQVRSFV